MSDDQPLVTIGMPSYNRADKNLPKALDSALSQTYANIEIIVSDNCSTDNTPELMRSYQDSRLRYIRQQTNLGANGNFNACLAEARGDYFLLFHDDDLIDPDFVESCMLAVNYSRDYGVIRTGSRLIDSEGALIWETENRMSGLSAEEFYLAWFSAETSWYLCSTMFNTQALREIGGFNSRHNLLEDAYAVVKISETWPRADVQGVKASFRKHLGQHTFAVNVEDWCDDFEGLLELMSEQVGGDAEGFKQKARRFFSELCRNRVQMIASPWRRMQAYAAVGSYFGYGNLLANLRGS